jgi:hypothetical protein
VDAVFEGIPGAQVRPEAMRYLSNGNLLAAESFVHRPEDSGEGAQLLVYDTEGHFYALYQYDSRKKAYRVRKMFGAGAR